MLTATHTDTLEPQVPRLTSLSHGGGCGCKIDPALLSQLLHGVAGQQALPPELLVGLETSDDAAVYRLNDEQALVATTDFFMPIVDDPYDFGRIAAANALSDVYAMGGQPILALSLLAMPIKALPPELISRVLQGGAHSCSEAGIVVAGGHSIDSVEPIYGLVALGLVHPDRVRRNSSAQAGDTLILGKPLGVGILAAALKKNRLDAQGYDALLASTTLLNRAGPALAALPGVHAMTDVTGFSLLGHTLEMARASRLGARLHWPAVPMLPGALALAEAGVVTGASARNWAACKDQLRLDGELPSVQQALLTDPQTSGGLLVSCKPEDADTVLDTLRRHGCTQAAIVGHMLPGPEPVLEIAARQP